MLSSSSATHTEVAVAPEDEIKTFYDFYLKIQQFKDEFPKLTFGFLDQDNIKTLETNARIYLDINDYLPEEEQKIILEYEKIQQRRKENKTFERSTFHVATDAKEIGDAKRFIRQVEAIENYKKAIKSLYRKVEVDKYGKAIVDKDCLFEQLKSLTENFSPNNQEKIEKIEQRWQSSSYLAFLSSPSLREVAEILDQFAKYLAMITKEFLDNQAYSEKFYEYYRGVREEKKLAFTKIIVQAKKLLENERFKLIQAMIARLNMQSTEILQEALENKQSSLAFNDDVVYKTLSELREFGLSSQYFSKFNPRLTLTHDLSRFFFEYIINYGSVEQKLKFSELLNGEQLIQIEGLQLVGGSEPIAIETKDVEPPSQFVVAQSKPKRTVSTHAQDLKSKIAVELQERYFEYIRTAAAKYFTPQSFTNHEILQALFQQTMLEYIANNCPLEDKLAAVCDEVYLHVVNGHINSLAFSLFPGYVDDDLRSIFCLIAQYLFRSALNDNFNQTVITSAQQYVVKINEAAKLIYQQISPSLGDEKAKVLQSKFIFKAANSVLDHSGDLDKALLEARMKLFVGIQQSSLKKVPQPLQDEFVEKCTKNLSVLDVNTDNRNLLHQVNVVKDYILAKSEVKYMLAQDYVRLQKKQAWFLSVKKTSEKVEALQNALETIDKVSNLQDLQTSVQTLLADKKLTQKRSIFSFFEFHSTSEKHLLDAMHNIAKYRRG